MLSFGIQKRQRTFHSSSSSSGGNTRTNAEISIVEERSKPPKHLLPFSWSASTASAPSSQIVMSIQRSACSVHMQKLRRLTIFCFDGMPTASRTCSRRYFRVTETSRQGLAFSQTVSSVHWSHLVQPSTGCVLPSCRHSSHASSWHT